MTRKTAVAKNEPVALGFIGAKEVEKLTAVSRWTLWRWERAGRFPKSIDLGSKRVWVRAEIEEWMSARVADRGTVMA